MVFIILTLTFGLLYVPSNPLTIVSAKTKSIDDVLIEIEKANYKIQIVGENKYSGKSDKLKKIDEVNFDTLDDSNSLWVSKEHIDKVLKKEYKNRLKLYLKQGKTIFLLEENDTQKIADFFEYNINLKEERRGDVSNVKDVAAYVMQNENNELVFGKIVANKSVPIDTEFEAILMESWLKRDNLNRRGDTNKPGEFAENVREEIALFPTSKASANSGVTETIGSNWDLQFGPGETTFVTTYGQLFERKRGYWLTSDGDTNKEYTALTMYWNAIPNSSRDGLQFTDKLYYKSSTSRYSTYSIEKYGPYTTPSSGTSSFSIGLSSTPLAFNGSWSVSSSDLSITNSSSLPDSVNVKLDLTNTSSYAQNTTIHEPALSFNIPGNSTSVTMNNTRTAVFGEKNCGMCSQKLETVEDTVYTYFTKN
jgi:hypothetical protein